MSTERFERAIAAIDAANADDPNRIVVRGREQPKELAHAELASQWIRRLVAAPSEALLLAARAHHLRRWISPRSDHPAGRPGYLRWRRALQRQHADDVAGLLSAAGYPDDMVERVQCIVQKRGLGMDAEVQAFEDALCLVFVETQLEAFAAQHPQQKSGEVLRKTIRKMSPAARQLALGLDLPEAMRAMLVTASKEAG